MTLETTKLMIHINEATKKYAEHYCHLFKADRKDQVYHAGTCFGVEHDKKRYLVTASHVLDGDENNPCDSKDQIFCMVDEELVQIQRFVRTNIAVPAASQEAGQEVDVVILELQDHDPISILGGFFSKRDMDFSEPRCGQYIAACGFPGTKNKAIYGEETLRNAPYQYFGKVGNLDVCQEEEFPGVAHFCFEFDQKRSFSGNGARTTAPKPNGISGGPVFLVHDFCAPNIAREPRLCGLVINQPPGRHYIVCIKINVVMDAILRLQARSS